jgi:hypothetical protein
MRTHDGQPITFAEWGYLRKGKFRRRDFRLDTLTLSPTFSAEGSFFSQLGKHEIFTPAKSYPDDGARAGGRVRRRSNGDYIWPHASSRR